MSLLVGLVKRAIVLAVAIFYGVLRATLLLVGAVRFGPSAVLTCKKRSRPPACLEDPSLGAHGYAHLEDIRMHYVSNGAEDKPLMLLVHGFPEFWYSWRHQLREFKDSYRVVAVDLRGYGDSDKPSGKGSYTVPKLVNDLKQIVTALGYSRCVLVGHDWGGILAWAFGEMYPDMITRLIVLNSPNGKAVVTHAQSSFTQFRMSWYVFFFQLPWLPEFSFRFKDLAVMDYIMGTQTTRLGKKMCTAEDVEAYKYIFSRNGFTGPINFYRASLSLANLSREPQELQGYGYRGIPMPTLIIWGDQDTALDKSLAKMSVAACTGRAEIKFIEGASHWVQMDRPDRVNKHMREFLAQE